MAKIAMKIDGITHTIESKYNTTECLLETFCELLADRYGRTNVREALIKVEPNFEVDK